MNLARFFSRKKENKKLETLSLLAIVAGFLAIVLPTLAAASIWFDEAFSAYIIRYDFPKIWHFTSVDVHPPLYYFALKIWSLIFGSSDFALRAMSVFFAVATIWVSFCLVKRIFGAKTAAISTAFLAISPMFVRYSQEIRMYTMVAFFAVLTIRAFYEIYLAKNSEKAKKKWQILFVVSAALGIWTQYLSGLTLVALWIYRAILVRKNSPKAKFSKFVKEFFAEKWFALNAWIMALFLPWIPFFLKQAATVKTNFWIQDLSFNTLPNYISNFFTFVNSGDLNGWWCLAIFATLALIIVAARKIPKNSSKDMFFFGSLAILPAVALFLASMPPAKSIFVDRYAFSGIVFLALFLGVLISIIWKKERKIACLLAIFVLALFVYGNFEINLQRGFSKTSNETTETRQIVEKIKSQAKQGEPIIVESGYFFYEVAQYSTDENKVWFTDWTQDYRVGSLRMLADSDKNKIKDISEFSKKYSTVWVIYNYGETQKEPMDSSWKLEYQEVVKDKLLDKNHYLIQKFSIQK